jgi:hypothetical protein
MTENHPITPPPELVQQWIKQCDDPVKPRWQEYEQDIANLAAQWGANQELEACCEWLHDTCVEDPEDIVPELRAGRRPKPPSLKELALKVLESAPGPDYPSVMTILDADQHALIRRALETLDD